LASPSTKYKINDSISSIPEVNSRLTKNIYESEEENLDNSQIDIRSETEPVLKITTQDLKYINGFYIDNSKEVKQRKSQFKNAKSPNTTKISKDAFSQKLKSEITRKHNNNSYSLNIPSFIPVDFNKINEYLTPKEFIRIKENSNSPLNQAKQLNTQENRSTNDRLDRNSGGSNRNRVIKDSPADIEHHQQLYNNLNNTHEGTSNMIFTNNNANIGNIGNIGTMSNPNNKNNLNLKKLIFTSELSIPKNKFSNQAITISPLALNYKKINNNSNSKSKSKNKIGTNNLLTTPRGNRNKPILKISNVFDRLNTKTKEVNKIQNSLNLTTKNKKLDFISLTKKPLDIKLNMKNITHDLRNQLNSAKNDPTNCLSSDLLSPCLRQNIHTSFITPDKYKKKDSKPIKFDSIDRRTEIDHKNTYNINNTNTNNNTTNNEHKKDEGNTYDTSRKDLLKEIKQNLDEDSLKEYFNFSYNFLNKEESESEISRRYSSESIVTNKNM